MQEISVNQFRSNLRASVERVIEDHVPLRVTRRNGEDFVVVSAAAWESDQEIALRVAEPFAHDEGSCGPT